MELERAEAIVKELLAPRYLTPPQEMVFRAAWQGRSYRELAKTAGYETNYLKCIGAQVWRMLSIATQCKISKRNFREVITSFEPVVKPPAAIVDAVSSGIDWGEAMDISAFYGRELERDRLQRWLLKDRCRLVAILGMGGMGKTTIALELVQHFQAAINADPERIDPDRFSCIAWRSLLNPLPLKELLPELIGNLTSSLGLKPDRSGIFRQLSADLMPRMVTSQLELLLEICQQHRCLMVLDNAESIFEAGAQAGQYRSGYADYGELFSILGRLNHQSCLLLTSREKPTEIGHLEGIHAKVRTLILPGLDPTAGQQIFTDRGCLPIAPLEWAEIDRYCGGNPLAFQLIAATVQEVADGDVSEIFPYLRSHKLGFADIYILLEQQWERLTTEEQQVMYWLAIGREPMSIGDLAASLHPAWNQHRQGDYLLSALQSLHRRSMIFSRSEPGTASWEQLRQRGKRHWSLQPMVMEYVTGKFVAQIWSEIARSQPFLLDTHAIVQANAKEYLRLAQLRTIVQPAIEVLRTQIGNSHQIGKHLRQMLADRQVSHSLQPGYLAGNLLNFLTHLKQDLTDLDCSAMVVRQAYLVDIDLKRVNFTNAQMVDCAFTQTFSSILAIAYSPDGKLLAASDTNGEIRLWSVRDGQFLLTCSGHSNWVRSIQFSPDSRYLASSSDDRRIKIWDLQDGSCVKTIGDGIHTLGFSFSPDGRYLASGSANNLIYYWDLHTGNCIRQFEGHQDWSMVVKFHPDGDRFASSSADGTIRIWDVASGRCDRVLRGHENLVTTVDYHPDGKTLLSSSLDGTLRLWDVSEGTDGLPDREACRLVLTEHGDEIWSAMFSPDGAYFASAGVGGLLRMWRTSDGYCLHRLEGHSDRLWSVAFHPNGDLLASGGEDRTIRFWQVSDGKCLQAFNGYTNWFKSIAWSPDGSSLITASRDALIRVWERDCPTCLHQLSGHTKSTICVAYDPQGVTFASGGDDLTIRIWDAKTLACLQILRGHTDSILALVYSPDGKYLVSSGSDLSIRIWDTHRWRCLHVRNGHTDRIGGLAYHPGRDLIASASEDRTIKLWNFHDSEPVRTFSQHANRAIAVAFDPRGTILASGGLDRQILLWNIETGKLCHTLIGHEGWILSLAYSSDGKWLFSGASDRTIKVWSMETGLCNDTLLGHQSWIWSVAASDCGRFLASASEDETVRIWDLADGTLLSTLRACRPYEGMNIAGVEGLTKAQINELKTLGAQG
jgi:WD40 repeat protein